MDPVTIGGAMGLMGTLGSGAMQMMQSGNQERLLDKQIQAQIDAQNKAQAFTQKGYDDVMNLFGGADTIQQEYNTAKQNYAGFDPTTQMGAFEWSGTAQSELDPSIAYQNAVAQKAMETSQAGKGMMYSGAGMKQLQDRAQAQGVLDYANADARNFRNKGFAYTDWINHFNNQTSNKQLELSKITNILNSSKGDIGSIANLIGGKASNLATGALNVGNIQTQGYQGQGAIDANQSANLQSTLLGTLNNKYLQQGLSNVGNMFTPSAPAPEVSGAQVYQQPTGQTAFNQQWQQYQQPFTPKEGNL